MTLNYIPSSLSQYSFFREAFFFLKSFFTLTSVRNLKIEQVVSEFQAKAATSPYVGLYSDSVTFENGSSRSGKICIILSFEQSGPEFKSTLVKMLKINPNIQVDTLSLVQFKSPEDAQNYSVSTSHFGFNCDITTFKAPINCAEKLIYDNIQARYFRFYPPISPESDATNNKSTWHDFIRKKGDAYNRLLRDWNGRHIRRLDLQGLKPYQIATTIFKELCNTTS